MKKLLVLGLLAGLASAGEPAPEFDPVPPLFDIVREIGAKCEEPVAGLGIRDEVPLEVVDPGKGLGDAPDDRGLRRHAAGGFLVTSIPPGAGDGCLGCAVGSRSRDFHPMDFLPVARGCLALGLEPVAGTGKQGGFTTRVVDPEILDRLRVRPVETGDEVYVSAYGGWRWYVRLPRRGRGVGVDVRRCYEVRPVLGEALDEAGLELATKLLELPAGTRLVGTVERPDPLVAEGMRNLQEGQGVLLERLSGGGWRVTSLFPGFPLAIETKAGSFDLRGLADVRFVDLPEGAELSTRVHFATRARRAGLEDARRGDEVVLHGGKGSVRALLTRTGGEAVLEAASRGPWPAERVKREVHGR